MGIDEVSERIGSLDGRVEGLDDRVERLTTTWQRQDQEATEGRRRLHAKFEAMQAAVLNELRDVAVKLTQVTGRMDSIDRELAAIKPTVAVSHDERQQSIGSKKAMAAIWGALFTLAGAAGALGIKLLERLWPARHP